MSVRTGVISPTSAAAAAKYGEPLPLPASAVKIPMEFYTRPVVAVKRSWNSPDPVSAVKVGVLSDDDIKERRARKFADAVKSSNPASRFPSSEVKDILTRDLRGTSRAAEFLNSDAAADFLNSEAKDSGSSSITGGSVPVPSGPSAASLDYYNADISKLYGMDKNTAYQEALSNTAYQRAVKDMQAAGLNPASLFGAGRASAADGVGYVGASGGYSGGRSSARAQSEFGMSKSDYTKLSGICAVLGTAAGAAAGYFIPGLTVTSGATLGGIASQGVAKIISQL